MIDLTGCPTTTFELIDDERVQEEIQSGEFWKKLQEFDDEGYLISASTPGEDRWTEVSRPDGSGLVPGHAYSIIQVKKHHNIQLLNIRNPWGSFEWDGDWSDKSPLWTQQMKDAFNAVLDDSDGTFWMSFEDFVKHFKSICVCRVRNWQEVRIRGKFLCVEEDVAPGSPRIDQVISRWYY